MPLTFSTILWYLQQSKWDQAKARQELVNDFPEAKGPRFESLFRLVLERNGKQCLPLS